MQNRPKNPVDDFERQMSLLRQQRRKGIIEAVRNQEVVVYDSPSRSGPGIPQELPLDPPQSVPVDSSQEAVTAQYQVVSASKKLYQLYHHSASIIRSNTENESRPCLTVLSRRPLGQNYFPIQDNSGRQHSRILLFVNDSRDDVMLTGPGTVESPKLLWKALELQFEVQGITPHRKAPYVLKAIGCRYGFGALTVPEEMLAVGRRWTKHVLQANGMGFPFDGEETPTLVPVLMMSKLYPVPDQYTRLIGKRFTIRSQAVGSMGAYSMLTFENIASTLRAAGVLTGYLWQDTSYLYDLPIYTRIINELAIQYPYTKPTPFGRVDSIALQAGTSYAISGGQAPYTYLLTPSFDAYVFDKNSVPDGVYWKRYVIKSTSTFLYTNRTFPVTLALTSSTIYEVLLRYEYEVMRKKNKLPEFITFCFALTGPFGDVDLIYNTYLKFMDLSFRHDDARRMELEEVPFDPRAMQPKRVLLGKN